MMSDTLNLSEPNNFMKFKFELLKNIYLACKTDITYKLNDPCGSLYLISCKDNNLMISSSVIGDIPDKKYCQFLESKISSCSRTTSNRSIAIEGIMNYCMFWDDFDIDKL